VDRRAFPGDLVQPATLGWIIMSAPGLVPGDGLWLLGAQATWAVVIAAFGGASFGDSSVIAFFPEHQRLALVGSDNLDVLARP